MREIKISLSDYENLKRDCEAGLSTYKLAKKYKVSQTNIQYWLKKMGLNTKARKGSKKNMGEGGKYKKEKLDKKYNWTEIQDFYFKNNWKMTCKKYSICSTCLNEARKLGLFKTKPKEILRLEATRKSLGRTHTETTRKKLSEYRKKYLEENPSLIWKKNNVYNSEPNLWIVDRLRESGYSFFLEYKPLLRLKKKYAIDIAFPEQKVGIEINGAQHYKKTGELKEYYQIRHDLIENSGWTLIEIKHSSVKAFYNLGEIEKILNENKIYPVFIYG